MRTQRRLVDDSTPFLGSHMQPYSSEMQVKSMNLNGAKAAVEKASCYRETVHSAL
jgi:hypothetical protein